MTLQPYERQTDVDVQLGDNQDSINDIWEKYREQWVSDKSTSQGLNTTTDISPKSYTMEADDADLGNFAKRVAGARIRLGELSAAAAGVLFDTGGLTDKLKIDTIYYETLEKLGNYLVRRAIYDDDGTFHKNRAHEMMAYTYGNRAA